jgi:hypothetical protein
MEFHNYILDEIDDEDETDDEDQIDDEDEIDEDDDGEGGWSEQAIRAMLVDGEDLYAMIGDGNRNISVTNRRIILDELDGNYSMIPTSQIAAIEVSQAPGDRRFLVLHFGGGLKRTIGAPNAEQAAVIAAAVAYR